MLTFIRRSRIVPLLLVAVVICLVLAHPALATDADPSIGASLNKLGISAFAGLFSIIIILIALFSIIFAVLLGDLMTSFYIFDTGMGDTLRLVWEVMRNFVNIVFILALLVIAARVIFGVGESGGTGFLKKILPKFVIALVAVNLTFFAARFVIGSADVLATAVFALPKTVAGEKMIRGVPCPETYAEFQKTRVWDAQKCSNEVQKIMKGGAAEQKLGDKSAQDLGSMLENVANATPVNESIKNLVTKENFALALLMNILRLDDLIWLKSAGGGWQNFIVGALGSIIMAGAIGVVYFMLFVAFLIRVVMLWIMIPLMPLGVLAMVMKEVVPGMPDGSGAFSLKGFINTAMMPVYVAFPLSIGMIMIFGNNTISTLDGVSIVSMEAFTKHFNVILWWAASIGVIWFGTKEAIKLGNEYAGHVTDAIHSKVNGAVSTVAGTLKYAPIFPSFTDVNKDGKINAADNISLHGLGQQPHIFENSLRESSNKRANALAAERGYGLSEKDLALKNFIDAKDKDSQARYLQQPEINIQLADPNNNSSKAQEARAAVFTNAQIKDVAVNMNAAAFSAALEKNNAALKSYYDDKTVAALQAAKPSETTEPAGKKAEGATVNKDQYTVYQHNNNRIIYDKNNKEMHNLETITKALNDKTENSQITTIANDLKKALELLSESEKNKWTEAAAAKLGSDAAKKQALTDALK